MNQAQVLRHVVLALACSFAVKAAGSAPLDVPFFKQEKNGCGAASVAMVAHYWGRLAKGPSAIPPPQQVYERLYAPDQRGISLSDMKQYLEELGYNTFTFRGEWTDLKEHLSKGRPIIVGLKNRRSDRMHFVVLAGAENDYVWLNDPTRRQPNRIKQSDFEKQWEAGERWLLLAAPSRTE